MSTLDDLLLSLSGAPSLPGASCRGLAPTFDEPAPNEPPADVEYRRRKSLAICGGCPVLSRCQSWLMSLPKQKRPPGVVAGMVVEACH